MNVSKVIFFLDEATKLYLKEKLNSLLSLKNPFFWGKGEKILWKIGWIVLLIIWYLLSIVDFWLPFNIFLTSRKIQSLVKILCYKIHLLTAAQAIFASLKFAAWWCGMVVPNDFEAFAHWNYGLGSASLQKTMRQLK